MEGIRKFERVHKLTAIKILVITGSDHPGAHQELTDLDGEFKVSYFLKKPVAYDTLLNIILKTFSENHI
jgi:hypothetical protein